MVEKVVEKMGYFGGKKEEEEGGVVGVVVVVVVGMEEEMEEKVVEELVEKWVVRVAGQEGGTAAFCCRWFSLLAGKRRKGK